MGFLDDIVEFIVSIPDMIGDAIVNAISNFFGMLLYYITIALMWVVKILQQLFDVFSGTNKVEYDGDFTYLTDVFFQNASVKNVYWAIALLSMAFVFVFTIVSVIKKTFDLYDKQQQPMGAILAGAAKSIFIMLIMSMALTAVLNLSNILINRIGYIFDNADSLDKDEEIYFTDEQYATMARIYKTIGNYSLAPGYSNRYNLNKCYNEIRSDLQYLEEEGVFDLVYTTTVNGREVPTWQSVLQELSYSTDSSRDLRMDKYYSEVSASLLKIMKLLQTYPDFMALDHYQNGFTVAGNVGLDRVLFLSGTTTAARNERYNQNPYMTDGLRGAFFTGQKDIYSYSEVTEAFDTSLGGIGYIFVWVLAYFTIKNLFRCIFICISRIFSMVSLYVISPLTLAPMALDGGEKFKQWMMAMTVQMLSVLGTIIPMRLIILFAPIVMSNKLVLFDSIVLNFLAKALLVVGGMVTVGEFGEVINGILANNSAMASLGVGKQASQMGDTAFGYAKAGTQAAAGFAMGAAKKVGGTALRMGGSVLGGIADVTGLTTAGRAIGSKLSSAGQSLAGKFSGVGDAMRDHGGIFGAIHHARKSRSDAKASTGGLKDALGQQSSGKVPPPARR